MKIRYHLDPAAAPAPAPIPGVTTRLVSAADHHTLARLMLDAYRGTIDYEGEDLDDAVGEVGSWLGSDPILAHSAGASMGGDPVSAVMVSVVEDEPFIGYVFTDPAHKRRGLARLVVANALASLAAAGHRRVVLYITEGNVASERLFGGLGAVQVGLDR